VAILLNQIIINGKDCTLKKWQMHVKATHFHQKSDRKYKLTFTNRFIVWSAFFYEMVIALNNCL
ncbi:hypothetical protein, partial [Acinetobacter baumannii]